MGILTVNKQDKTDMNGSRAVSVSAIILPAGEMDQAGRHESLNVLPGSYALGLA